MNVAKYAASTFKRSLSKEKIEECILNALWIVAKKYKSDKGTKITTYVFQGVVFECLNEKRRLYRTPSYELVDPFELSFSVKSKDSKISTLDMIESINIICNDPTLIIDRYYKNMTLLELSHKYKISPEGIRGRINKNLQKLREAFEKSV